MPFCPKCGKEVPEEASFCYFCGYNLRQVKDKLEETTLPVQQKQKVDKKSEQVLVTTKVKPEPKKSRILGKAILAILIIFSLLFLIGLMAEIMYGAPKSGVGKLGLTVEDFKLSEKGYIMYIYDEKAPIAGVLVNSPIKMGSDYYILYVGYGITPTTNTKINSFSFIFKFDEASQPVYVDIFSQSGDAVFLDTKKYLTSDGKGTIFTVNNWYLIESGSGVISFAIKKPCPKNVTFIASFVAEKNGVKVTDLSSSVALTLP